MNNFDKALARPGQPLLDHSVSVSELAQSFGEKFGMGELLRIAGFLHDLGKESPEFQAYLCGNGRDKVLHSIFGAKRVYADLAPFPYGAEIAANIIAAHHTSLYDILSPHGNTPLTERLNSTDIFPLPPSFAPADIGLLKQELITTLHKLKDSDQAFGLSMLIKLVYSCLIDADRLDAFLFDSGQQYKPNPPDWSGLLANLEKMLSSFDDASEIGAFRKGISDNCLNAAERNVGIYKLEVPTGGGKTLSSLRFALKHAICHGLDRIIYIIPYLSILSQTAKVIQDSLGANEDIVLEHHSGFLPEGSSEFYKLQTDRWDAPIILTTQVQFLESLFSAKGSDLRKMHNMVNSVIIFDEAQSLPIKCIHLFNVVAHFLHKICNSTILLCTATQPLLDTDIPRPLHFSESPSIAKCGHLSPRTQIVDAMRPSGYSYEELAAFVLEKHELSTLVIVNTKASAKALFEEFKQSGKPVLHLSTNMCAAHRDEVIAEIKGHLEDRQEIICVSTQLIEAGVDISFECVVREVAGMDSIWQGAGRCNRHGEFGEAKAVYVINIAGQKLDRLPDIKKGAEVTMKLFAEGRLSDIDEYYRQYFHARKNEMDYFTKDGGTIYDLLSDNCQGKQNFINNNGTKGVVPPALRSAIRSAAEAFYVIDRGRFDVVVPYGKAMDLIDQYSGTQDFSEKRDILRRLGKYSVSLYQYQMDRLGEKAALYARDEITILSAGFYDPNWGVNIEGDHEFLIL